MAPCDKSVVETGTGSLEAGGGSGEPPEALIPEANDFPGCVRGEAVQGGKGPRQQHVRTWMRGLRVPVGRFRQVGEEAVKAFMEEDGPGKNGGAFWEG